MSDRVKYGGPNLSDLYGCTTHFHACDCREAEFERIKAEHKEMREGRYERGTLWNTYCETLKRLERAERLIKKYESAYSQREKIGADMGMSEKLFLVEARAYFREK